MTKAGIEHNLSVTPYMTSVDYIDHQIVFCFSSETGREKFCRLMLDNRKAIRESLSNRFKMPFHVANDFCDIQLYRNTERRGFLIKLSDYGEVKWMGDIGYQGKRVYGLTGGSQDG